MREGFPQPGTPEGDQMTREFNAYKAEQAAEIAKARENAKIPEVDPSTYGE